mmetsp:Transcript_41249/g.93298  ORF Transcript_41249/g.93298 Transcript_41249/m.93298 type:complete len:214 (-) Transcript_41249:1331-1972(-)
MKWGLRKRRQGCLMWRSVTMKMCSRSGAWTMASAFPWSSWSRATPLHPGSVRARPPGASGGARSAGEMRNSGRPLRPGIWIRLLKCWGTPRICARRWTASHWMGGRPCIWPPLWARPTASRPSSPAGPSPAPSPTGGRPPCTWPRPRGPPTPSRSSSPGTPPWTRQPSRGRRPPCTSPPSADGRRSSWPSSRPRPRWGWPTPRGPGRWTCVLT